MGSVTLVKPLVTRVTPKVPFTMASRIERIRMSAIRARNRFHRTAAEDDAQTTGLPAAVDPGLPAIIGPGEWRGRGGTRPAAAIRHAGEPLGSRSGPGCRRGSLRHCGALPPGVPPNR